MFLQPHRIFLAVCGINALILVVLTPPFQVHDEFQHFFRAYQLSEGRLWGIAQNDRAGDDLPASLQDFVMATWGTLRIWESPPLRERPLCETWAEFSRPLAPAARSFADFSGSVVYAPLAYLPQAAAIAVGRLLELPPIALLYLGRVANALVSLLTMALALRLLPIGRWSALVIAALPMAQYEYGSVAPDAVIISTAFLFIALAVRAGMRRVWRMRAALAAVVAGLAFCSIKYVYAPLLAPLLPALRRGEGKRTGRFILVQAAIALCILLPSLFWMRSTQAALGAWLMRDGQRQRIADIIADPAGQVWLILRDLQHHWFFYTIDTIGIFGVFNIFLPGWAYVAAVLAIPVALLRDCGDRKRLRWPAIIWAGLMLLAAVAAIETALSIFATAPGAAVIHGVQGRYFLPLGALWAVVVGSLLPVRAGLARPQIAAILAAFVLLLTVATDWTIITHFNLFERQSCGL